jgi:hypothetical protein
MLAKKCDKMGVAMINFSNLIKGGKDIGPELKKLTSKSQSYMRKIELLAAAQAV